MKPYVRDENPNQEARTRAAPQVAPRVGGDGNGNSLLWLLLGAAAAGVGVWALMRNTAAAESYSPVKNLGTGAVTCLPESTAGPMFGGGSA